MPPGWREIGGRVRQLVGGDHRPVPMLIGSNRLRVFEALGKPFSYYELSARVRALLRRTRRSPGPAGRGSDRWSSTR